MVTLPRQCGASRKQTEQEIGLATLRYHTTFTQFGNPRSLETSQVHSDAYSPFDLDASHGNAECKSERNRPVASSTGWQRTRRSCRAPWFHLRGPRAGPSVPKRRENGPLLLAGNTAFISNFSAIFLFMTEQIGTTKSYNRGLNARTGRGTYWKSQYCSSDILRKVSRRQIGRDSSGFQRNFAEERDHKCLR